MLERENKDGSFEDTVIINEVNLRLRERLELPKNIVNVAIFGYAFFALKNIEVI